MRNKIYYFQPRRFGGSKLTHPKGTQGRSTIILHCMGWPKVHLGFSIRASEFFFLPIQELLITPRTPTHWPQLSGHGQGAATMKESGEPAKTFQIQPCTLLLLGEFMHAYAHRKTLRQNQAVHSQKNGPFLAFFWVPSFLHNAWPGKASGVENGAAEGNGSANALGLSEA